MVGKKDSGKGDGRPTRAVLAIGAAVGAVFPVVATLMVEPKSSLALALFWVMSIAAGVGVGFACEVLTQRAVERTLTGVLRDATEVLGFSPSSVSGQDAVSAEIGRVFAAAATMLDQIRAANENIRAVSAEVLAATEQQALGASQQAASVSETSATLEELAQTSSQIADNSEAVVRIAESTLGSAEEGMSSVAATAAGIEEIRETTMQSSDRILALGERSQEIGRVLSIIDEIAEQTKILALNAAIEAARAGDAGKGFSVVAEEIRKLADSVTESTSEIDRVVREIQTSTSALIMQTEKSAKRVAEGQVLASHTATALERIVSQVEQTTDAAKQISIATQQQRTASDQVVIAMREVSLVSQQAAEASRKITSAIVDLTGLADSLARR
ncbi:MAG: methyl-accepting chemotaxis protein [Coriobacteriia bacterium]|nr:methyl-accepting chemotaxis protein [Coriobacteriia bacterium]